MDKDYPIVWLNLWTVCQHLGISVEEMKKHGTGEKIVKTLNNLETLVMLKKAEELKNNEG